ncbi:MAG: vanadium-dependent haloperoxidase [Candidatus Limnocylindria bacterium]
MTSTHSGNRPDNPLSRRSFLRRAGGAAAVVGGTAVVGLGPVIGSRTRAAETTTRTLHPLAKAHDASVAQRWVGVLYDATRRQNITPTAAARGYACMAVALYQAVCDGMPGYRSLVGQLNGLSPTPRAERGRRYDWPTTANSAMATMATALFSTPLQQTTDEITALEAAIGAERRSAVDTAIFDRSAAHGRSVGRAIVDWTSGDGLTEIRALPAYVPPVGPDKWISTPPNFGTAIEPYWGQMRPFILPSADACFPPPHVRYDETAGSAFHAQAARVVEVGAALTEEQRFIAMFWRDNPLTSGLPAGHWFVIGNQLVDQLGLRLDDAAEMYARLGVALADAFISCWHAKYEINLLRPITYIRRVIDPAWNSFVNTPQFPEYTSGHSVASRAAAAVLTDLFGPVAFTDTNRLTEPPSAGTRHFASFQAAADEAAGSRLYGGIHYPMGIEIGLEQGAKVGAQVVRRLETFRG